MYLQYPLKATVLNNIPVSENISPEIELSNFLTESVGFIRNCIKENIAIDTAVSKLTFKTTIGKNHFDEIAKMRAARILWAKMIKAFNPKKQDSLALNIQVSIFNSNHALTAILGGCQSLISNNKIHLFFEEETGITKTVDPWAGSTYLEKRTEEIAKKSWNTLQEIEEFDSFS